MSAYASEKRAPGICDRCGMRHPLRRLRSETIGGRKVSNRVCPTDWDEDHPQNFLGRLRIVERVGLKNPRPDNVELQQVRSRPGWNPVGNEGVRLKMTVGQAHVRIT